MSGEGVAQAVWVADETAKGAGVEALAAELREKRRYSLHTSTRAGPDAGSDQVQAAACSPSGTTRSLPPLPRMCTVSFSKSTSTRSRPTASALRSPAGVDRARAGRGCGDQAGLHPHLPCRSSSTSSGRGVSGRWRERRGFSASSGTRAGPSAKPIRPRTAASLRAIVRSARRPGCRPAFAAPVSAA